MRPVLSGTAPDNVETQTLFGDAKAVIGGVIDEFSWLPTKEVAGV